MISSNLSVAKSFLNFNLENMSNHVKSCKNNKMNIDMLVTQSVYVCVCKFC